MTALLDVHRVGVVLEGDPVAVEELSAHFAGFLATELRQPAPIRVRLTRAKPTIPTEQRRRADQILERGVVYNWGAQIWIDHHGLAASHYDYDREAGEVVAEDAGDLVELGYLMVHSRLGVHLERRGLVRVHGVGFSLAGRSAIVLSPSGGGKSRLALALLHHDGVRLLSDDLVLLDGDLQAHPFPHPIGITDPELAEGLGKPRAFPRRHHGMKWVIGLDELLNRHEQTPTALRLVALASRVNRPPSRLLPASRRAFASALWRDLVVGLGLPQVLELIARRGAGDLWTQAPSVIRRARAAAMMVRKARPVHLEVADPESAAAALVRELQCMT